MYYLTVSHMYTKHNYTHFSTLACPHQLDSYPTSVNQRSWIFFFFIVFGSMCSRCGYRWWRMGNSQENWRQWHLFFNQYIWHHGAIHFPIPLAALWVSNCCWLVFCHIYENKRFISESGNFWHLSTYDMKRAGGKDSGHQT